MKFQNIDQIKDGGFSGFVSVGDLYRSGCASITEQGGVYMILRNSDSAPRFLVKGSGGYFQGKEPNVDVDVLKEHWNDGTCVLYVGKSTNLRRRLSEYMRFGHGEDVGHYGGRFIWQLAGHDGLIVCWKPTASNPRNEEISLIQEFTGEYGKRPFANLRD